MILGMHKSGTSLVAEILHKSGIAMVKQPRKDSYDTGNKFERQEFKKINEAILKYGYSHSLRASRTVDPKNIDNNWYGFLKETVSKMDHNMAWGFKDPRSCLTFSVWKRVLPAHKIIVVWRSPEEVWRHYQRHTNKFNLILRLYRGLKSLSVWYVCNKEALRHAAEAGNNAIILNYSDLINGKEAFLNLQRFVNHKLEDCRKRRLYRSKTSKSTFYQLCLWWHKKILKHDIEGFIKKLSIFSDYR